MNALEFFARGIGGFNRRRLDAGVVERRIQATEGGYIIPVSSPDHTLNCDAVLDLCQQQRLARRGWRLRADQKTDKPVAITTVIGAVRRDHRFGVLDRAEPLIDSSTRLLLLQCHRGRQVAIGVNLLLQVLHLLLGHSNDIGASDEAARRGLLADDHD